MDWEQIDECHERAKVFGGWLVKASEPVYHMTDSQSGDGWDWRVSMTFVPDPDYKWEINHG